MPKITKTCPICEKDFQSYPSTNQTYCSRACSLLKGPPSGPRKPRKKAVAGKVTRTCAVCSQPFQCWDSYRGRFCSRACGKTVPNKPRRGDTIPCDVCGTTVYRTAGEIKRNRRLCSWACHNQSQTKTPVIKNCLECGEVLTLKPSQANVDYCSRSCYLAQQTKRPLGWFHNGREARLDAAGYIIVWEPDHPNQSLKGWQPLHRLVAEKEIGRFVEPGEDVHHKNLCKTDNRPENLEVMSHLDHLRLHGRLNREQRARERRELAEYRRRFGPLDPPVDFPGKLAS